MNTEVEKQINTVVDDFFTRKLKEIERNIGGFGSMEASCENLDAIREANSWLKTYADFHNQPGLYTNFRYHAYTVSGQLFIVQGSEHDTEPRKELP
jgi:hypothetical protein